MNIIDKFNDWRNGRRITRLEEDLRLIQSKNGYDPKYVRDYTATLNAAQDFTLRINEYHVWFSGSGRRLRLFYASYPDLVNVLAYFWQKAPSTWRKVHSGIPGLIAKKMATILFGGGLSTEITVTKEDGKPDKEKSKAITDVLKELIDKTAFAERAEEGATTESWSGHVFFKLSYDTALSPFPIIEIADVRQAEPIRERGITKGIAFCNYYESGAKRFVHKEIYSTNENGDAVIYNQLFSKTPTGLKEVVLTAIPETAELEPEIVFEGLKGMLAFEKPNKIPNAEFPDCGYGESDFAGATNAFDALDETVSEIFAEIRNNKTIRYIPESMLEIVERNGNIEAAEFDSFITNYQKINDRMSEAGDSKIDITQIEDKTLSHLEKWKVALTLAVNKAGLSPLALGITGLEAVNAGMQSQRERNKTTLETRAAKIKLWQPFLGRFFSQLLKFNEWLREEGLQGEDALYTESMDLSKIKTNVKFGDYISETTADRMTIWGGGKMQGVASTEQSIREIHPDWEEVKVQDEVNRIRYEQGMSLDTPDNLPELNGMANNQQEQQSPPDNENAGSNTE